MCRTNMKRKVIIQYVMSNLNFNLESNCRNKVNPRNYEKRSNNLYFFLQDEFTFINVFREFKCVSTSIEMHINQDFHCQ